jgi:outer membrane receptor protein involved in Fe transport
MAWVYRESIRRPGMGELNPSIDYSDPYNIRFGNAYLSPSLTDNYDFNINYVQSKFNINGSFGYNKMKNVFNVIRTLIDSGKTQTTYQNISDQNEYQASFASGITLSKQWRININAGYNYYQYSDKQKTLYKYQDGGSLYSSFSFTFSPDAFTIIEGNTRYSKYANPHGTSRSSVSMAFGVQRKFFNKKMVVALNAVDPFGLLKYSSFTYAPNFYIESHSESNTKNFRLTISYQLSKVRVKSNLSDKQKTDAIENTQNKKG